jgi:RNA polymerase sigma factor (sigma-70 family)
MAVIPIDTLRILEVMADNISEFPRGRDSFNIDEETDEEFGLPEFKGHLADSLTPAVLRDWSAADFASIYVRFRPHLERHARKFLTNPSQVEEVVQEAFLYLMTTLPELDSELGVLKFLKWKTRLLALDVIRANSKVSLAPLEDAPELESTDPELSRDLERAEDAGIVALALSKIPPRHREAIIATLYEEKSAEVVASQMGISENAFRQLMFRARASFRVALVGEAEIQGKSISEILSIAARKAARDGGKYISAAGAFLLVLAISIGVVPNLSGNLQEDIVSAPTPAPASSQAPAAQPSNPEVEPEPAAIEPATTQPQEPAPIVVETVIAPEEPEEPAVAVAAQLTQAPAPELNPERNLLEEFIGEFLTQDAIQGVNSGKSLAPVSASKGAVTLSNGTGLSASVAYDTSSEQGIQYVSFLVVLDGVEFAVAPERWLAEKTVQPNGITEMTFVATDLLVGDITGNFDFIVVENSILYDGAARLKLVVDAQGTLVTSSLSILPRELSA